MAVGGAAAVFLAACASSAPLPPQEETRHAFGRVVEVAPAYQTFTLADEITGRLLKLEVEGPSRLYYGEAPVAFTALEPGSVVRASYARDGSSWTAIRVEVIAHPGELDGVGDRSHEEDRGGR